MVQLTSLLDTSVTYVTYMVVTKRVNRILITFDVRLSWALSHSPCSSKTEVSQTISFLCSSFGGIPVQFYCTDSSTVGYNWSSEWGSSTLASNVALDNPLTYRYNGSAWIQGSSWNLVSSANLSVRDDTGTINSPPVTDMIPIVLWSTSQNHVLQIPVWDADGDIVKCRLAVGSIECGTECDDFPETNLDQENCIITYTAGQLTSNDYRVVAIQIEDFAVSDLSTALSSIPLQFLIYTNAVVNAMQNIPSFIERTPENGDIIVYKQTKSMSFNITAMSLVSFNTVDTISPIGFEKTIDTWQDTSSRYYINASLKWTTWTPFNADDAKAHVICFAAINTDGQSSEVRCVHFHEASIAGSAIGQRCKDDNYCKTSNSECRQLPEGGFCTCMDGYVASLSGMLCEQETVLGGECTANDTCITDNSYCTSVCACLPGFVASSSSETCEQETGLGGNCTVTATCTTNNSTCSGSSEESTCVCAPGFTVSNSGLECEQVDLCYANPCKNSGTCSQTGSNYSCTCTSGYIGTNCETGVSAAAPSFIVPSSGIVVADSITESIAPGSAILILVAQDTDADRLTYSIKSQSPSSPAFVYDAATDKIRVPAGGLDAETSQSFVFVFSVSDGTTTVDSEQFTLTVDDVNEHSPVFSPASYTGSVTDIDLAGTLVLTVTATDQDVTATITYSITAGNIPDTFTINGTTGEVTIGNAANVDTSTTPSYTLNITASDGLFTDIVQATITVSVDLCYDNPCENSGSCSQTGSNYSCSCTSGYIGTNCETETGIGGNCTISATCKTSHTTCSGTSEESTCVCEPGFTVSNSGLECEQETGLGGECTANYTCITDNSYCSSACTCLPGFVASSSFETCEQETGLGGECTANDTCTTDNSYCTSVCACLPGFVASSSSETCEQETGIGGNCTVSATCKTSHTTCSGTSEESTCVCEPGYTISNSGLECEQGDKELSDDKEFQLPLVAGAAGWGAAAIIIVVVMVIVCRSRKQRKGTLPRPQALPPLSYINNVTNGSDRPRDSGFELSSLRISARSLTIAEAADGGEYHYIDDAMLENDPYYITPTTEVDDGYLKFTPNGGASPMGLYVADNNGYIEFAADDGASANGLDVDDNDGYLDARFCETSTL